MEVKALVKMLAYRAAEEKAKKVSTRWAMCRPGHLSTNLLPHLQREMARQLTAQYAIWRPRQRWKERLTRYET